jgi:putative nucleotidyltransferase with HDIG domain
MQPLSPNRVLFFAAFLTAALIAALFPFSPRNIGVSKGDIASRDVHSPRSKTFQSEVLTEQARSSAANAVPPVLVYDPSVQGRQIATLSSALKSVDSVRKNEALDQTAKRARLLGIRDLGSLSRASIDTVLSLPGDEWQKVQDESSRVLSDTLSRSVGQDSLQIERDGLFQQISPDLSAGEANLVADLVQPLVVPTLISDEDATATAREAARQNVQPVQQTIAKGQVIVSQGTPIDATAREVMAEVDLLAPRVQWQNVAAVAVVALLAAVTLAAYLWRFPLPAVSSTQNLVLLSLVIAVPLFAAKVYFGIVFPDESRRFLPYFLPLAVAPMLIATLLEERLAVLIGLVQAGLLMFIVVSLPDLSLVGTIEPVDAGRVLLFYAAGAIVGSAVAERAVRPNQYLLGGLLVALVSLATLFAMWLLEPERSALDALWMTGAASVSGLSSGILTAGSFALFGALLGVTTRVQLMELSQLNAPLLRRMQDEAPGTFHHSVIVGNLAERAAYLIGADALLTRVGCYYHDIGKVVQPGYYIENQLGGSNPHDTMEPSESAQIIAEHVRAGVELAKQHRLPPAVRAFIPQHHGTRLIPFFFRKASQQDENVDEALYRYPGPRPQRRETAIVMLADGTEAMVRAGPDHSPERIDQIVEQVLAERLAEGELDECDLTLRDLRTIAESFKQTLRGVYHPRIAYPEATEPERRALIGRFRPGRRLEAPEALPSLPAAPARARTRRST